MHAQDLKIHSLNGYIETLYLAEYPDKLLLLDGGSRADVKLIENFIINNLKRPVSDLKLMISSHMHPDHAGAAPILRKKYGIPIAAHFESDEWYAGLKGHMQQKMDIFMAYYVVHKRKTKKLSFSYPAKLKPDILLREGDILPMFNDWKVIHAPGHTSHQIVLYQENKKILYAADVLLRINHKFQLPFPVELKIMGELTLLKLAKLSVNTMLLAHGGICREADFTEAFYNLIPKLYQKLQFPMTLLKYFAANNPPLKKYWEKEKGLEITE